MAHVSRGSQVSSVTDASMASLVSRLVAAKVYPLFIFHNESVLRFLHTCLSLACDCDPTGSLAPTCSSAGQCSCKPGVGGPTCGDCLPDYYNFTAEGCTPCECSQFSSSVSCNVTTGQCLCPEGVTRRTCDTCLMEFFNLSSDGCQSCDCDVSGSVSGVCDPVSGQCPCTGNLGGRQCSECEEGFFNTGGIGGETCLKCVCSGRSSDCSRSSIEAQLQAIRFNFTQLCSSDPIGCGDGWRVLAMDNTAETFFGPK